MWAHVVGALVVGILVRIVFVGDGSWWGSRSSDDIVTFWVVTLHGRCSRVMTSGLEIRVIDGVNTWSLIGPGYESSERSVQLFHVGILVDKDDLTFYLSTNC